MAGWDYVRPRPVRELLKLEIGEKRGGNAVDFRQKALAPGYRFVGLVLIAGLPKIVIGQTTKIAKVPEFLSDPDKNGRSGSS